MTAGDPPAPGDTAERAVLGATLEGQREHVLGIVEGLSDEELRRPVLPSGWTCLGLIQHLAVDVEQLWFQTALAGQSVDEPEFLAGTAAVWQVGPEVPAASVLARYRREIERADAIIAATSLDAAPAWWPEERFPDFRLASLRELILHVITETACHAGHLDAVRELIDGRQWLAES
jgi:uncharacterized damage-inducible protein DinB